MTQFTYRITDVKTFNDRVVDVELDGLVGTKNGVHGTVSIDVEGEGCKDITGEHGLRDYEEEFGFIIVDN